MVCVTRPVEPDLVHDSWRLRPPTPKRLDWYYTTRRAQSTTIADRATLLEELGEVDLPEPLEAPETARGFYLEPDWVERLHLGQDNGVHDRVRYTHHSATWTLETLVP